MNTETQRSGKVVAVIMRTPADFDAMTVTEFFDYVRWWASLPSSDRQLLIAAQNQTRH